MGFSDGCFVQLGATWDCMLATYGALDGCLSNLELYTNNPGSFETDVLSTSSYSGGMLLTLRRKFIQLRASWGCMLGTDRVWHGCLSTWGYLGLYVGKLQGLKLMFVQLEGTWDCMLGSYGLWDETLFKFELLGTVCWQTWDGCLSNLGHLGLYVGNDGALRWMFVQLWATWDCMLANYWGFETDVCPTWNPWDRTSATYQLGATWECMLATYRALRRMFCPTWGYLGLYVGKLQRFETDVLSNLRLLGAVCWQPTGLWDRCLFNLGLLGLYVGNLHVFDMDVCPTWGYLGLYVGNLHCFDTDVCPTWGYLGLSVGNLQGFETNFVQVRAGGFSKLGLIGTA